MFALCKLLPMTDDAKECFIRNQLAGLKALGLDGDALAREETLLRTGFAQNKVLSRLFAFVDQPPLASHGEAGGQAGRTAQAPCSLLAEGGAGLIHG